MNLLEYFSRNTSVSVNINEEYGLASVKYVNLGVDWTQPHMLDARGLVIDLSGNIIARPYSKFFNYKQLSDYTSLPEEIRDLSEWHEDLDYVMDKADGSLVIAYAYKDELMLSSSGSVLSEHSKLFYQLLNQYPSTTKDRLLELGKTYTLNLEYVSPFNQIVIPYKDTKFILHGARVTKTGEYVSLQKLKEMSEYTGIELIKIYNEINSFEKLIQSLHELEEKEGFVVSFKDGFRLKFKTEEYIKLHGLYTPLINGGITRKFVVSIVDMITSDTFDDYISSIDTFNSDEAKKRGHQIVKLTLEYIDKYNNSYIESMSNIQKIITDCQSRKDIAKKVMDLNDSTFFNKSQRLSLMSKLIDNNNETVSLSKSILTNRAIKDSFTKNLFETLTKGIG